MQWTTDQRAPAFSISKSASLPPLIDTVSGKTSGVNAERDYRGPLLAGRYMTQLMPWRLRSKARDCRSCTGDRCWLSLPPLSGLIGMVHAGCD